MLALLANRKILSLNLIFLVFLGGFFGALAFMGFTDEGGVAAATTRYVGNDQPYKTITSAVSAASSGDTIRIHQGTFVEKIEVTKTLSFVGNGTAGTAIDGGNSGNVITVKASGVSIFGLTVKNSGSSIGNSGIAIISSDNCKIENCGIDSNMMGIQLESSSNCTITNSSFSGNFYGIYFGKQSNFNTAANNTMSNTYSDVFISESEHNSVLESICQGLGAMNVYSYKSSFNRIIDNIIKNGATSMYEYESWNNKFINNTCSNNRYYGIYLRSSSNCSYYKNKISSSGFYIMGYRPGEWNSHVITSDNQVNDKPVYYWKNASSGKIPKDAGQVIIANCSNVIVRDLDLNNTCIGVAIGFSDNISVTDNNCSDNYRGIFINSSDNCVVKNNSASNNLDYGIMFTNANNNIIYNNSCNSNRFNGILLSGGNNNKIMNNSCNYNIDHGITIGTANNNSVSENSCRYNYDNGIAVVGSYNNSITFNTLEFNGDSSIEFSKSYLNSAENNSCNSPISLVDSSCRNMISNNTVSRSEGWGINLRDFSNNNTISWNNFSGLSRGIYSYEANYNIITNNTFIYNTYYAVWLRDSEYFVLRNNNLTSCGIYISGMTARYWVNHDIDTTNKVNGKPMYYLKNQNGGKVPSGAGQVILAKSSGVSVEDQVLDNASTSIILGFSDNITMKNNRCSKNSVNGIYLFESRDNLIDNNSCTANKNRGIYVYYYSYNNTVSNSNCSDNDENGITFQGYSSGRLENNYCTNNMNGLYLESVEFEVLNNTCIGNIEDGLFLTGSPSYVSGNRLNSNGKYGLELWTTGCTIIDNVVNSNGIHGIYTWANNMKFIKNYCSWNREDGIRLSYNQLNTLLNNTCISNSGSGIRIHFSDQNVLENNTLISNRYSGIHIYSSERNNVSSNNCSYNKIGIHLNRSSVNNRLVENTIANNKKAGLVTYIWSRDTSVYHNNFISNAVQAVDNGTTIWNNSENEGNYWSDYSGSDNGAGGRPAGDGIGDTAIPHLGLDNYPFILKNGWRLRDTPFLFEPGDTSIDGYYKISWTTTWNYKSFRLQEDDNAGFSSPSIVYDGNKLSMQFTGKQNGTYYYRVCGYNQTGETKWSNIVNITVDWVPAAPADLSVKDISGRKATLFWQPNTEPDILGYHILINDSNKDSGGPYHLLASIPKDSCEYSVINLQEETIYYFVVVAFDKILSNSTYSGFVKVTTSDETAPSAPADLTAEAVSGSAIVLTWSPNPEPDIVGYLVYMNKTGSGLSGEYLFVQQISGSKSKCSVSGLSEQTTYYFRLRAFDEVPNNSTFSETAYATTLDTTIPSRPMGLNVINPTTTTLTISWNENPDSDVVGYKLFRGKSLEKDFTLVDPELITGLIYVDENLEEDTIYYYKLTAVDDFKLESEYSDIAEGRTKLGPHSPELNNTLDDFSIREDSYVDNMINLYTIFRDVNGDRLMFRVEGDDRIKVTIYSGNGTVVLMPEHNWNGKETLKFYATDGIFDEIYESVTVTVTPAPDRPYNVSIIEPEKNLKVVEGDKIDFIGTASDPDLPYGDSLTFTWYSDIDGRLGVGEKLEGLNLTAGNHSISLLVEDSDGNMATATIELNVSRFKDKDEPVEPEPDDGGKGEKSNYAGIVAVIAVGIIVIVIILMFLMRRKGFLAGLVPFSRPQNGVPPKSPTQDNSAIPPDFPGPPPANHQTQPGAALESEEQYHEQNEAQTAESPDESGKEEDYLGYY